MKLKQKNIPLLLSQCDSILKFDPALLKSFSCDFTRKQFVQFFEAVKDFKEVLLDFQNSPESSVDVITILNLLVNIAKLYAQLFGPDDAMKHLNW